MKDFELNLDEINKQNPFLTVAVGVILMLKAKLDLEMTKHHRKGPNFFLACSHGLHQSINEPTYLLDSVSSCIDLVFTSQPNLVIGSGIQLYLHPNCHHQFVFAKFDLFIYYPPPYERAVWYYNRANADLIRRVINLFD